MITAKSILSTFILIVFITVISYSQSDNKLHTENIKKDPENTVALKSSKPDKSALIFDKDMYLHALKGYDAVAYFTDNKAEPGNKDFTYNWMNTVWQFSGQEHMNLFIKNPTKFAPQFGGFAAYGVVNGILLHTDGTLWTIENGKLYLDVNKEYQDKFRKDIKSNISKAEAIWPKLRATIQ